MNRPTHKLSENPWDGSESPISSPRAKPADISKYLKTALLFWTFLILLFLGLSIAVKADQKTAVKKDTKPATAEIKVKLKGDVKKAAEEYAYLLEQLLYLSSDYCRYFEKLDDKSAAESYRALANMCVRITEEERYENVNKILAELNNLKKELADREEELARLQKELEKESSQAKQAHANLKALKLTSTLREELESIDEQMQREVVWQMADEKQHQEAVNQYVRAIVNDSVIRVIHSIGQSSASNVYVYKSGINQDVVVVEVPDAPDDHYAHVTPVPHSTTPVPPVEKIPGLFETNSFSKELRDSLLVSSSEIDIYIANAFGNLEVIGWPQKQVYAIYTGSISSDNLAEVELLDKKVHLRLYYKQNKIYIESVMPPLTDPKMKISKSYLHLMVPVDNNLFVSNSSGNISINGVRSDVVVKGATCNVDLNDINGNAEVVNSSGSIALSNVRGKTNVQNRMGPVSLVNCNGTIDVGNSFGMISISNSDGNAVIRNTGPVSIAAHVGNMEITNRSGQIDVTGLEGDLAAFNSFEPLIVQDIKGTAKLVNANALVDVNDISGMLSVTNRFAPINVSSISGPFYIENKSGDINLRLNRSMTGSSSIMANGAQITLAVDPRTNLLMTMESLGGLIDLAGFDATIEDSGGGKQTATLKVGNGSNTLDIKAGNSKLFVKPFQKLAISNDF